MIGFGPRAIAHYAEKMARRHGSTPQSVIRQALSFGAITAREAERATALVRR
jgi:hypothetical protein